MSTLLFSDIVFKKILNYCLIESNDLSYIGVYSKRNLQWNNILYVISLSLVCKKWATKVIPYLLYPSMKIKTAKECSRYMKYKMYGILEPQSITETLQYPSIQLESIDIYNLHDIGKQLLDRLYDSTMYSKNIDSIHFANQSAFEYEDDSGRPLLIALDGSIGKERFVQNVCNIKSLEFSIRSQGDVNLIQYILENNRSLTTVRLSILFEGTYPLGKMLASHPSMKNVYLQQISFEKMPHAIPPPIDNTLETIELSNFNLRDNTTLTLIDMIKQSQNLRNLYLNGVSINRLMIESLLEPLSLNTSIKEFTFIHNEGIRTTQASILNVLATNKTMTRFEMNFDLYDNIESPPPPSFKETQYLPSSFETLKITSNIGLDLLPGLSTANITKLTLYFIPSISTLESHFQNVTHLVLDRYQLDNTHSNVCDTICLLGEGTLLPNLTSLYLGNTLDEWTWRQFFSNLILHNRTLTTLGLNTSIDNDIIIPFLKSNHPSITSLFLWLTKDNTNSILSNTSINNLCISSKSFSEEETLETLVKLLLKPTLQHLSFSAYNIEYKPQVIINALHSTNLVSLELPFEIISWDNSTIFNLLTYKSILPYQNIFK